MHVIGVLNTKGGAGKTTLTCNLSVRAAEDGATAVCDLDPQSSYSDWYRRRGSPKNPMLLVGEERASDAVEKLQLASPYQYVFLDGPPSSLLVTEDAVKSSTLVIIPMRASGFDLGATRDCITLCQDHNVPYLVVLNDKNRGDEKLIETARSTLFSWKVPIAETAIAHRVPFVNAITTGKTGAEKDKRAAEEIDALWKEIKAALRKAARRSAA